MLKILSTFLMLALLSPSSHAQDIGDVCGIRPDLCDDNGSQPSNERRPSARKANKAARHQLKQQKRQQRSVKRSVKRQTSNKRCRKAGEPYRLNNVDLPICGTNSSSASDVKSERGRHPSSAINIDAYMNSNANHPAFARRLGDRQNAFQETVKPAVMGLPSQDSGVAASATEAAPLAAAPDTGTNSSAGN
ncbi:MAG: hypothetical protein KF799_10310 [Bdellovibrionales bacterium]|nr:hypothetical protein [Bdellovibrionales bacterium]